MTSLLDDPPFAPRDDARFLDEMQTLTRWHLDGCAEYRRVWPTFQTATSVEELPYLHVGLFKHLRLVTQGQGIELQRTLTSSSTTGGQPSKIVLDARSSELQARSSQAILTAMLGPERRPLLVLDDAMSLRRRGEVSARTAAAMSLRPLSDEIHFVLDGAANPTVQWNLVRDVASKRDSILVYGFTWVLWTAWANGMTDEARAALAGRKIHFVHSGGWKKLESLRVRREQLDEKLTNGLAPGSGVLDYYGLVEQVGVIFPLCEHGFRHVPRWAQVLVRDPWSQKSIVNEPGLLQLMNVLAFGGPYHNVLTEDMGRVVPGPCPCGRAGARFELLGRVPKAEVRGCANV